MNDAVELDTKKLDELIKSLSGKTPQAKVGIIGNLSARTDDSNNAAIGLKHEFGMEGLPIRSFLRMPLIEFMQKYLDKSDAFSREALKDVIAKRSITPWITKIGFIAETIIADAFQSGGFGKWKPSNMNFKKNHQTLVETQQLRNSITSEVVE